MKVFKLNKKSKPMLEDVKSFQNKSEWTWLCRFIHFSYLKSYGKNAILGIQLWARWRLEITIPEGCFNTAFSILGTTNTKIQTQHHLRSRTLFNAAPFGNGLWRKLWDSFKVSCWLRMKITACFVNCCSYQTIIF